MLAPQPQWLTCHSSCSETLRDQATGCAWPPLALRFMDLSSKTLTLAFALEGKDCSLQWHLREFGVATQIKLNAGRTGKLQRILQRRELERRFREKSFNFCFVLYFGFCYFLFCVLFCVMDFTSNV